MSKRILLVALGLASSGAFAQTFAGLNDIDPAGGYQQNFDALGTSTITAPTNGNLGASVPALAGFFTTRSGGASNSQSLDVTANTGASATGGLFNYGTANSTDRALGGLYSNNFGSPVVGLRVRNNTTKNISLVGVKFAIEQYRGTGNGSTQNTVGFSYALVASTLTDAQFVSALASGTGFTSTNITGDRIYQGVTTETTSNDVALPRFGDNAASGALDGNLAVNRVEIASEIDLGKSGGFLAPGQDIAFRWIETNNTMGADAGFGIDNVQVVPEPASMAAMALGLAAFARRRRSAK